MVKYYGILNQTIKMCNLNIFAYILESMSRITFAFEVIFIVIVRVLSGIGALTGHRFSANFIDWKIFGSYEIMQYEYI